MDGWNKEIISQLQLPDPSDTDSHPRLVLDEYGIHAGSCYMALMPDGWHDITLEVKWESTGVACWYISNSEYRDICPVGLFVKI